MDALEKLRQIGINRINRETKISIGMIDNIIHKRFEKIQRVWIVGFLPILEREYQIDLSAWLEEYDAYYQEHQQATSNNAYKIKELELDTQQQKYDNFKRGVSKGVAKQITLITFGVCCVIVIFMLLKLYSFSDNTSTDYSVVEKPFETEVETKNQGIYSNINAQQQNFSTEEKKSNIDIDKIIANNEIEVRDGEVLIIPKGELWFQILNLENKQKQDRTIREPYLLKIPSQKSIVIFGHKGFDLKYKDKTQKYDGGDPIRFVTENNILKYIRYAEYLKLLGVEKKETTQEVPQEKEQQTQEVLKSDNAQEVLQDNNEATDTLDNQDHAQEE